MLLDGWSERRYRRLVAALQEGDALAIKRKAHGFKMHQMGAAADLDVALDGRGGERVEQPARIRVGDEAIPVAADECDRRRHPGGIVRQLAMPRREDVGDRAGRDPDAGRVAL